jgi:hypothetical protein
MSKVDQFFDPEIKAIAVDSKAIALGAAEELRDDRRTAPNQEKFP